MSKLPDRAFLRENAGDNPFTRPYCPAPLFHVRDFLITRSQIS